MIDMDALEKQVSGTSRSLRAIAKDFEMSHTQLNKIVKKMGWPRYVPPTTISKSEMEKKGAHVEILGRTALRKIEEIKRELGDKYSNLDEPLIVMYSKSYEHYIDLEKKIAVEGYVVMSPKTGATYLNPTFSALQSVQKTLVTIANQLGLSMASRKALGLQLGDNTKKEQGIFAFIETISTEMDNVDV
ncbi:P27 family phage terminase small subunit [Sulfurospirillum cavolei]|uniref:P27 family phage terminase small subunit n=1 Tax=Sulfurospirillum cavolei TaxID=366522 RepID=UPI003FA24DA6